jgi:hypothetical protein
MTLSETPGALKKFRRTTWRFQQTFGTPLKNLQPFVATIITAHEPFERASLTIDGVIFEPKHLLDVLAKHSLPRRYRRHISVTAAGRGEIQELLEAVLSDWIDFIFVPEPKPFVIYADHDEYTTFYANTKLNLNRVVHELRRQGFEIIPDYERKF